MIIYNNVSSIFANRQADLNTRNVDKDMQRLSSGLRINSAADDASGLAVSEKMRTQIRGTDQAMRNTQDAISFLQTTEGYLQEVTNTIQRVRELSIQAANGIYSDEDRGYLNAEIGLLVDEIDRVAESAQFNSLQMLSGRYAAPSVSEGTPVTNEATASADAGSIPPAEENSTSSQSGILFQIGPNQDNNVQVFIQGLSAQNLGLKDANGNITVGTSSADMANLSIGRTDAALQKVTAQRTELGAYQNRFESTYKGLYIAYENTVASESRIRDTNMARAVSTLVKDQILLDASVSMIAQANLKPQMVLSLLR